MNTLKSDPLLGIARLAVTLAMGLCLLVAGALTIAAPLMLAFRQDVFDHMVTRTGPVDPNLIVGAFLTIMIVVIVMAVLAFLFLRNMRRIIDSVGHGDPFVPINADRLMRMGWLTLAIEAAAIPAAAAAVWIGEHVREEHIDFGISLTGLLLALVLFILARVFRTGAAMREELEGTV